MLDIIEQESCKEDPHDVFSLTGSTEAKIMTGAFVQGLSCTNTRLNVLTIKS